ncbi:serine protease [Streptomyces sp. LX-29]|uniref:serine protease n=1 Tax=Streptomyces sp. LX-29 TaxID=2900152 RepID=UPI00240DEBA3|nr:serine protease [Streptomyces sp. LX-29]WFB07118.1 serine protease [Streptomyces sp. LX-29]
MVARRAGADQALVRIRDLAGRPRGTGFLADAHGTLVTSHETVDGLARLVLYAPGDRTFLVDAEAVTALPEADLALVRTEGLGVPPLPVAAAGTIEPDAAVRLRVRDWLTARVVGSATVTYTATDRFHLLGTALELTLETGAARRRGRVPSVDMELGGEAAGGPVLDARTGAVVAVVGTALHAGHRAGGFAVPLRAAAAADPGGPLAALLDRNAATVPAYGRDLNLAGALQLTATSAGSAGGPRAWRAPGAAESPVERPRTRREFERFAQGEALVLGLVGDAGTGRTTELAALAARRARGPEPAPTVWLRGADLSAGDGSVREAVARALRAAGRVVTASAGPAGTVGDASAVTPEDVAGLARAAGRPLFVLLDGPEEMPPRLAHRLAEWTAATARWLREADARLVVACRPEHWERAGALFPDHALHRPRRAVSVPPGAPARTLPDCVRLGELSPRQAEHLRERYGLPAGSLAERDARHPLALRLLAEVRAALPGAPGAVGDGSGGGDGGAGEGAAAGAGYRGDGGAGDGAAAGAGHSGDGGAGDGEAAGADRRADGRTGRAPEPEEPPPDRCEIFAAYLDLVCLRVAVRLAAAERPPRRGTAVRRLAARVAGQVHEAARRCLGPGQGELDRDSFEEIFPWRTGWASAVLSEGLLVPAGGGYRFAHEEFADWLEGLHLDLDAALYALVHRWYDPEVIAAPSPRNGFRPQPEATPPAGAGTDAAPAGGGAGGGPGGGSDGGPGARSGEGARGPVGPGRLPSRPPSAPVNAEHVPPPPGSAAASVWEEAVAGEPDGAGGGGGRAGRVGGSGRIPVPRHRIGPVVQALLLLSRRAGPGALVRRLRDLIDALDHLAACVPSPPADASWWAAHLLGEVLLRVPDAGAYREVLEPLADRITQRSIEQGGFTSGARPPTPPSPPSPPPPGTASETPRGAPSGYPLDTPGWIGPTTCPGAVGRPLGPAAVRPPGGYRAPGGRGGPRPPHPLGALAEFGPWFWLRLPLTTADRVDLLRRLIPADAPPAPSGNGTARRAADRFLGAVAGLLRADPCGVQPLLCRWFTDERPLAVSAPPDELDLRPTVAAAAQALLHTHRLRAVDDLVEALVESAHPRADELLTALAEDEPSAVCRAVDRWAHDERTERHVAAAAYGLQAVRWVGTEVDRELLRYSALTLLDRPADCTLHGAALALLVRDPATRARHLPQALARFAAGDPHLPPITLVPALETHPEPVLTVLQARLYEPGEGVGEVLRALAEIGAPALARRAAALVRELVERRPSAARYAAEFVDRRLEQGPSARAVLFPLVVGLLRRQPAQVRHALAPVLAAPGTAVSRPLRQELLDVLLERERYGGDDPYSGDDPYGGYEPGGAGCGNAAVLDALLRAAAEGAADRGEARSRDLVHRIGALMVRTPEGAACFDRRLVQLAREVPGFARLVRGWLEDAPTEWAAVVGPGARRECEVLAGNSLLWPREPPEAVTVPVRRRLRQHPRGRTAGRADERPGEWPDERPGEWPGGPQGGRVGRRTEWAEGRPVEWPGGRAGEWTADQRGR